MMQVAGNQHIGTLSQFLPFIQASDGLPFRAPAEPAPGAYRVMIVEGNPALSRLLATGLAAESARVDIHENVDSAMQQMPLAGSDMLILDMDLDGVDSLALLTKLRAAQPSLRLLALSKRNGVEQVVAALNHGADDYLFKPFSLLEMLARVRALRRRSEGITQTPKPSEDGLVLHKDQSRVKFKEQFIDLTPRECELLEFMMEHPGVTLSRSLLSQQVWNIPAEANTNIVDVYVKYLRDKLERVCQQKLIRTVRGIGYIYQQ